MAVARLIQVNVSGGTAAYFSKEFPMGHEAKHEREKTGNGLRFAGEPSLTEMLADPVVQAVMSVDHVTPREIKRLMVETKGRREES
ncbi:MAG TPA: hypothetical protein VH835_11150 [Dongiaceae bacterium]